MEEQAQRHRVYQVWRRDDNGNEFLVVAFDVREAAEKRMAELAAGGHMQTYWIKEAVR